MKKQHYHPLLLIFNLIKFIRNNVIIFLFLFIFNWNNNGFLYHYGRMIFVIFSVCYLFYLPIKYITSTYQIDQYAFYFSDGVFSKSKRTIPFSRIQTVTRHTSFLHRIFRLTSIKMDTGANNASAVFSVVTRKEAEYLEAVATGSVKDNEMEKEEAHDKISDESQAAEIQDFSDRTVHFKPSIKELTRAAFTSLSFIVVIPVILSLVFKFDFLFHVQDALGWLELAVSTWWISILIIGGSLMIGAAYSVFRIIKDYGNYVLSSDANRIYVSKGIIEESTFTIAKQRVQAVSITQTFLKKLLGLAEVKLISVGSFSLDDDTEEINNLYPYLPVQRAHQLIAEILPGFSITEDMKKLPKQALWLRLLKPSFIWIAGTAGLFYFRTEIFGEQTWWILSLCLFLFIEGLRYLNYHCSAYCVSAQFIQIQAGGLTTELYLSKRDKVIEISCDTGPIQRLFGLASISIVNRAQPVHHTGIDDLSMDSADEFYTWYYERTEDIVIKDNQSNGIYL